MLNTESIWNSIPSVDSATVIKSNKQQFPKQFVSFQCLLNKTKKNLKRYVIKHSKMFDYRLSSGVGGGRGGKHCFDYKTNETNK